MCVCECARIVSGVELDGSKRYVFEREFVNFFFVYCFLWVLIGDNYDDVRV